MRHGGTRPPDWLSGRQDDQLHVHGPMDCPKTLHGQIAECIDRSLANTISIRTSSKASEHVDNNVLF